MLKSRLLVSKTLVESHNAKEHRVVPFTTSKYWLMIAVTKFCPMLHLGMLSPNLGRYGTPCSNVEPSLFWRQKNWHIKIRTTTNCVQICRKLLARLLGLQPADISRFTKQEKRPDAILRASWLPGVRTGRRQRVHIRSTYYTRINRGRIMYQRARNESQRIYLSSVTERQSTLAEPDLQNSGPVRYNVGAALVLLLISQNFPLFSDACLHGRPSLQSITLWNLMRFVAFWIGSLVFK